MTGLKERAEAWLASEIGEPYACIDEADTLIRALLSERQPQREDSNHDV